MTGDPDSIGGAALRGHHPDSRTPSGPSTTARLFNVCSLRPAGGRHDRRAGARLLNEVGLKPSPGVQATIAGRDPVLAYRFPVGEAAAVALAACGVAVSSLWELRGGRPQRARVEVLRAAASLHSRDYLSLSRDHGGRGGTIVNVSSVAARTGGACPRMRSTPRPRARWTPSRAPCRTRSPDRASASARCGRGSPSRPYRPEGRDLTGAFAAVRR
jgi:hypothetical protein